MALDLEQALRARKARHAAFEGLQYHLFNDDCPDFPRGTAVFDDQVVYGYPRIGRILALNPALAEQFAGPFWMEEKVDGYNVRIVRVQGRAVALTRGGFICPFTTDRLVDLMDLSVFDSEPDLVVCGEVAGPDNPYLESSAPFVAEDVQLFVFDFMRRNEPDFLSHERKRALLDRFGLPPVQDFGRFAPGDLD
ncbi:MAG TPA: RNA ligase, partial [Gammaproteobacteria bacterium]|nr:RNA ligase [Gammaproteobacteria bacterium]